MAARRPWRQRCAGLLLPATPGTPHTCKSNLALQVCIPPSGQKRALVWVTWPGTQASLGALLGGSVAVQLWHTHRLLDNTLQDHTLEARGAVLEHTNPSPPLCGTLPLYPQRLPPRLAHPGKAGRDAVPSAPAPPLSAPGAPPAALLHDLARCEGLACAPGLVTDGAAGVWGSHPRTEPSPPPGALAACAWCWCSSRRHKGSVPHHRWPLRSAIAALADHRCRVLLSEFLGVSWKMLWTWTRLPDTRVHTRCVWLLSLRRTLLVTDVSVRVWRQLCCQEDTTNLPTVPPLPPRPASVPSCRPSMQQSRCSRLACLAIARRGRREQQAA